MPSFLKTLPLLEQLSLLSFFIIYLFTFYHLCPPSTHSSFTRGRIFWVLLFLQWLGHTRNRCLMNEWMSLGLFQMLPNSQIVFYWAFLGTLSILFNSGLYTLFYCTLWRLHFLYIECLTVSTLPWARLLMPFFPTAFAHICISVSHFSNSHSISNWFIILLLFYLLQWSVISDLWYYCYCFWGTVNCANMKWQT